MKHSRSLAALATLAVLLVLAGCKDDKPTQPSVQPTLAELWPNEDGRFWSYDGTMQVWGSDSLPTDLSPTPLPLPSLTLLAQMADERTFPTPASTTGVTYRLQFADSITTMSGVRRQNLAETLTPDAPALASAARPGAVFLRRLALARPDLRPRIAPYLDSAPAFAAGLMQPLILHGYAWEKTVDWIGTYGDVDLLLAWKYLDGDLRRGHEFVHQLVPSLASDVYLRARVLGTSTVETPAGRYTNAIEVFYVIDYGVSEVTDESGNSLGYSRSVGYGTIHFVPGVGPVASYERVFSTYGPNGLGAGYGEMQFRLGASGLTS